MNKKIVLPVLAGAGMLLAASGTAAASSTDAIANACMSKTLYSDATCACVAANAQSSLSPGQYSYLVALVDDTAFNAPAARRDAGLSLGEAVRVHGFAWTNPTRCVLSN